MSARLFLRLPDDPLYAPETTVPAGTMQELAVPRTAAPLVAHAIAYHERFPAGADVTERVLPDGALRLIVETVDEKPSIRVVGPDACAVVLCPRGEMQGLSFALRPGASRALLGVPAHALAGNAYAWDEVAPAHLRTFTHRLWSARPPARARVLLDLLRDASRAVDAAESGRTVAAMQWLRWHHARRPVREASLALGIGERRLEQLFREHAGLGPKTWHRLARFQECVRLLRRQGPGSWAGTAAEAGYHDQAHMANEFRAICGLTPGQFAATCRDSGFSKTLA